MDMASVGPAPSIPRRNNGAQDGFSEAEQDCKITSSNHSAISPLQNLSSHTSVGVTVGGDGSADPSFFCGATAAADSNGISVTRSEYSGGGTSEQPEAVMFNPSDQGSRNSNSYSTSDSSITSSTNNYSVGGGAAAVESDLDASVESCNYRAPCLAEDDAGSSSHSEVRSSSPGLADADADVEDSPSGSEGTGSESERGGNSAPNMYAPNTVGFPPSRSSLTHCSPTPGSFGSTVKFAPGSNPFAVKGLPPGSISSSSSPGPISSSDRVPGNQNSNNSFSPSSRINAGRWGSGQPQPLKPASLNTRPIIRPSALATSLGGSGVTSSTPSGSLGSTSVFGGTASARAETGFLASTSTFGSVVETSTDIKENPNEELHGSATGKEEAEAKLAEPSLVFVPLAKSEAHSDTVSAPAQASSGLFSNSGASNNFASISSAGAVASSSSSSFSAVSQSDSDKASSFVFGSNLHARVSNVAKDQEETLPANGISSSSSESIFSAALRNVQGNTSQTSPSSSQEPASASKPLDAGTSAFGDMTEAQHADRKRRFEDVPVITGEEDEFNVLQITCRLFGFDSHTSSWTERGRGQLRLNDRTEANNDLQSRIIVRTKGSLRLMLNTNVWAGMKVDRTSNKSVRFSANDNGHLRLFLVMATVGEADQFYQALDWRIKTLKAYEDQHISQISEATSSSLAASSNNDNMENATRLTEVRRSSLVLPEEDLEGVEKPTSDDESSEGTDEENEELQNSPTKKKRFIDHPSQTSSGGPENSKETYCGFRSTPTILINNHEMKDLDVDESCLD
ncbi:unnamed protein product [Allacma fusca]|uniref:RanBD1 domain-containing protein n=1 Tax=Allacma fusca TaxID=39272 RepID=A0A8J2JHS4_9HEXA|nr:unnamed protein product [Allacma fusca]